MQLGAPGELYESPRGAFTAGFMGDANRVRGSLAQRTPTTGDIQLGTLMVAIPHRGLEHQPRHIATSDGPASAIQMAAAMSDVTSTAALPTSLATRESS